jgi:hypothetical protein
VWEVGRDLLGLLLGQDPHGAQFHNGSPLFSIRRVKAQPFLWGGMLHAKLRILGLGRASHAAKVSLIWLQGEEVDGSSVKKVFILICFWNFRWLTIWTMRLRFLRRLC